MAKVIREKAINSPDLLKAETEIKRQTAVINEEKAQHEARRAKAEVELKAAQAQMSDAEAQLKTTTLRAELIFERRTAFIACRTAQALRYQSEHGTNSPCDSGPWAGPEHDRCEFRWQRRCLEAVVPSVAPPADVAKPEAKAAVPAGCTKSYGQWVRYGPTYPRNRRHAAYVVGETNCGWSVGKTTLEEARRVAMEECQGATKGCVLYEEQ
ncbi:MAG: hypothetical protein JSS20_11115 [Proteobacteria bacterium]|nr:hypothetical protein [Pseudomonadota bacterium]